MMEGLAKYWGFYLVAVPDTNGVGVTDLRDALHEVSLYDGWESDLSRLPPDDRTSQSELNRRVATRALQKVFAARIVVFELFLQLAIQLDGDLQEKHRRIWLLFQLSDYLNPEARTRHPFHRVIQRLRYASSDALAELIGRLDDIREKYLPHSNLVVGLDEAQRATRLYPSAFLSSTENQKPRSILREIARVLTQSPVKLVVSGTGLSLAEVQGAMASGVSKPDEGVKLFHELGMFDTWLKLKPFLERYIPPSVLKSPSGYHLQLRIREYLLGR
jgi:hypothetical protein